MTRRMLLGIVVLAACIAAGIIGFDLIYPYNDRTFDRRIWLANPYDREHVSLRGPMADDLCAKHLPDGMPRTDVRKLLGRPDEMGPAYDRYLMGSWTPMSIDGDYILIRYDKHDRLESTEIVSH